jgi:hypothetical protein
MKPKTELEAKQKICPVMSGSIQKIHVVGVVAESEPEFKPVLCQGSDCNWWQTTTDRKDMGVCLHVAAEQSKG